MPMKVGVATRFMNHKRNVLVDYGDVWTRFVRTQNIKSGDFECNCSHERFVIDIQYLSSVLPPHSTG